MLCFMFYAMLLNNALNLISAGAPPGPRWGSLQRSPRPPSCVWGGEGEEGKGGIGKGMGSEREGKGDEK